MSDKTVLVVMPNGEMAQVELSPKSIGVCDNKNETTTLVTLDQKELIQTLFAGHILKTEGGHGVDYFLVNLTVNDANQILQSAS